MLPPAAASPVTAGIRDALPNANRSIRIVAQREPFFPPLQRALALIRSIDVASIRSPAKLAPLDRRSHRVCTAGPCWERVRAGG